ncbi:MAG TPA: hypothetical protein VIA62_02675 [Thermoanaerobaculia bacterium]|jgi:hypothetical protein|nr:hypothetical protein [Thermoanaerobaculia bacterium]
MKGMRRAIATFLALLAVPVAGHCGGAWVMDPGKVDVSLGFSRKTANTSWNANGDFLLHFSTFNSGVPARQNHDFRYTYLSGEIGLLPRLSGTFLVNYLYGLEGPHVNEEKNVGFTDSWFGLKLALAKGNWPMALDLNTRSPFLYDFPGPYNRYILDSKGNRIGVSPKWRGLLKHDYTLGYMVSHSYLNGEGWMNFEAGYTWREGAPADAVPAWAEVGYPLHWHGLAVKGALNFVHSLNNDTKPQPDDRFGSSPTYNFNNASYLKAGVSFIVPIHGASNFEIGYNQWIWGRSARQYREPFLSIGTRF